MRPPPAEASCRLSAAAALVALLLTTTAPTVARVDLPRAAVEALHVRYVVLGHTDRGPGRPTRTPIPFPY